MARRLNQVAEPLGRAVLSDHARRVAPRLLGGLLATRTPDGALQRCGRIVEVEAYGGAEDAASHAHRGRTRRNASMFGRPGTLYCYRSYGIHTCANVTTGAEGEGQAVLLRALEPLAGIDQMFAARRAAERDTDLASGPGKLCEAMGISLEHDGVDLCDPAGAVVLLGDGGGAPSAIVSGPRVGISRDAERPWRFWLDGNVWVSR